MKKGFTLVELLAVIVILAIILVIAVPQITKTIKASRLGAIESSAKLIASNAEDYYLAQQTINPNFSASSVACTDVAKLSEDYDLSSCSVTYNNGKATVVSKGATGKKFDGITCRGTKDNISCSEENNESNWVYAFDIITDASEGEEDFTNIEFEPPVFIRYNKNDISERYVCTTYNMTNNEPTCISADAYSTRNDEDGEFNIMRELFNNNCSEYSSNIMCKTAVSPNYGCSAGSDYYGGYSYCYLDYNSYQECRLHIDGSVLCYRQ